MKQTRIALVLPFWDIKDQIERLKNLSISSRCMDIFAELFNRCSIEHRLDVIPMNLGRASKTYYSHPNLITIEHNDLQYSFEKPTRMNSAIMDLHHRGYDYLFMVDPDLILLDGSHRDLYFAITNHVNSGYNIMSTFGFVRTKPEFRKQFPSNAFTSLKDLEEHPLIIEANQYAENWKVCGGSFIMHIPTMIAMGGFNEEYRVYGFDDVDFTHRFELAGGRVIDHPNIKFHHLWHPTVISNATDVQIHRWEHELKYYRLVKQWWREQMPKNILDRKVLLHLTPRFEKFIHKLPHSEKLKATLLPGSQNTIYFNPVLHGRHSIDNFPLAFRRQLGIADDDFFYVSDQPA